MPTLTEQQNAFIETVSTTGQNVCSEAVAGAGKSFICEETLKRMRGNNGYAVFNNHNAEAIRPRLNGHASVSTLHTLGFRACLNGLRCQGEPEFNKAQRLLQGFARSSWFWAGKDGAIRPNEQAQTVLKLTNLCKFTLSDPTPENLDSLVDHFNVDIKDRDQESIYAATGQLLDSCRQETGTVDFADMIWLPVIRDLNVGNFDTLFVDEVQDLNLCQQTLAQRSGKRLVVVGDSKQAIYGFTGASCKGMADYRQTLTSLPNGCIDRPLSVTFRCPTSHVALAQRIVPWIQAAPGAIEGTISVIGSKEVGSWILPGDLVISRTTAPLVSLAYQLMQAGIPCLVRGREIGKGLTDLINMMRATSIEDLVCSLEGYKERELVRLNRKQAPEASLKAIEDKVESLTLVATRFETVQALKDFVYKLFSDKDEDNSGKVILATVHGAKGLEAIRVIVIAPEKLTLIRKDSQEWQIEQEYNLIYIAATRSKRDLIFAGGIPSCFGNVSISDPMF